jgi:hypothetical protein
VESIVLGASAKKAGVGSSDTEECDEVDKEIAYSAGAAKWVERRRLACSAPTS